MVTETGLKLRTKLESAKTLRATTDSTTSHSAGDMILTGVTPGVVVEDVATSSDYVLVYEAEKIVVPKASAISLSTGDLVYFDATNAEVTDVSTSNTKCGRALEDVDSSDSEVLIDLMVIE